MRQGVQIWWCQAFPALSASIMGKLDAKISERQNSHSYIEHRMQSHIFLPSPHKLAPTWAESCRTKLRPQLYARLDKPICNLCWPLAPAPNQAQYRNRMLETAQQDGMAALAVKRYLSGAYQPIMAPDNVERYPASSQESASGP